MAKMMPPEWYRIENRAWWTEKEARREYQRIRHDVVRRRVEAMQAKGLTATPEYKAGMRILSRPSSKLSGDELSAMLVEAGEFALGETRAPQVARAKIEREQRQDKASEKASKTLQSHGYNVPARDMKQFGMYMQTWRNIPELAGWDSGRVARLYDKLQKMGGFTKKGTLKRSIERNFDEWLNREPRLDDFMASGKFESGKDLDTTYQAWEQKTFGR